jgi:hypothetical protein
MPGCFGGAFLSNGVAGFIAHRAATTTAFLVLAAIAGVGLCLFAWAMPETLAREQGNDPEAATASNGNALGAQPETSSC